MPRPGHLTVQQAAMLRRVKDRGFTAWCVGRRAGGATSRMADRLVAVGFLKGPPYEITDAGRAALGEKGKES